MTVRAGGYHAACGSTRGRVCSVFLHLGALSSRPLSVMRVTGPKRKERKADSKKFADETPDSLLTNCQLSHDGVPYLSHVNSV